MRFLKLSSLFAALLWSMAAQAMTFQEVDLVCPIGGEKFRATLAGSGTSFGMFLDTRPMGPTPAPWPLARCPGNGFVMFSSKLMPQEIQRLEAVVNSEEYQKSRGVETNYALAAKLMAAIGAPRRRVAYVLVQASWEARVPEQHLRYIEEALAEYNAALETTGEPEHWVNDQLLAGELERRLGRFDQAAARFTALLADARMKNEMHIRIARFQLELAARSESRPQLVPSQPK
jgi:hypothetical protein